MAAAQSVSIDLKKDEIDDRPIVGLELFTDG